MLRFVVATWQNPTTFPHVGMCAVSRCWVSEASAVSLCARRPMCISKINLHRPLMAAVLPHRGFVCFGCRGSRASSLLAHYLRLTALSLWLITERKQQKTKTSLGVTGWSGDSVLLPVHWKGCILLREELWICYFSLSLFLFLSLLCCSVWSMCGNSFGGLWEEAVKRILAMYVKKVRWRARQLWLWNPICMRRKWNRAGSGAYML